MPLHLELGSDWGWMLFSSFNFISMPCRSKQSSSACPGFGTSPWWPWGHGTTCLARLCPRGLSTQHRATGEQNYPQPRISDTCSECGGLEGGALPQGMSVSQPRGHLSGSPCGRICWQLGGGWGSRPCLHAPHHMDEVKGGEEEEALPPHSRCCSEGACAQGTRAP